MADIARLDFSKPPPLFDPQILPQNLRLTIETAGAWGPNAIAAAWALTKERSNPPGMETREWPGPDKAWIWSVLARPECRGVSGSQSAARAAAWAWYERRLALAERLAGFGDFEAARTGSCPWWPASLFWSDEQVSTVERWMADLAGGHGPAELPEVLRE